MKELQFITTWTISQFKAIHHIEAIEIIKNPSTSKLFFSAGTITGAVSRNYKENTVISKVIGSEGEEFFLIHKKASENTVDTL